MKDNEMDIYLVVFDEKSFSLSTELYGDIDAYINDNYVAEKSLEEYPLDHMPNVGRPLMTAQIFRGVGNGQDFFKLGRKTGRNRAGSAKETLPDFAGGAFDEESPVPEKEFLAKPAMSVERSLEEVVRNLDKTFMELVFSFADAKGLTDVEVQKRANLDRKAFSKLKCGTTKNPSKATALALAVALELDLDDTKDLLSRAGLALSPCSKQDVIVQYFIERGAYDIYEINVALFEHGEAMLGASAGS